MSDKNAGVQFENRVRQSLRRIGFRDIEGGPKFQVGAFQVDACGGWDDVLLVIECTQSVSGKTSIRDRISEVRGKISALRKGFRSLDAYRRYDRFVFALVTENINYSESDQDIARNIEPRVELIDYQVLQYYQDLAGLVQKRPALYNLLGELNVTPRDIAVPRLPAFRVRLDKNSDGYLFFSDPHDILKITYVARRETGRRDYYQRMLKRSRLANIKKFIQDGEIFPNNIVVAFDESPQFHQVTNEQDNFLPEWLEFGELTFPKSYRSCWIIDGQHRLYSFGAVDPNPKSQKLAVFAFDQLSESRQAKFFIDINKEQKPVSPDLIWDLEGDMRSDTDRGLIANCVKNLNNIAPLEGRVYIPLTGEKKRGQLTISTICRDIEEVGLLRGKTRNMPANVDSLVKSHGRGYWK